MYYNPFLDISFWKLFMVLVTVAVVLLMIRQNFKSLYRLRLSSRRDLK